MLPRYFSLSPLGRGSHNAHPVTTLPELRARFDHLGAALTARSLPFRPPPPEPTTCCGRGCNGCVWESWYAAAQWWCEDAEGLLATGG